MQLRLVINLVLLIFIVSTTLFLTLTETEEEEKAPTLVSDVAADQINEIIIERKDKETIRFNKQNNTWVMQSPYQINAHQQRIDSILNLLTSNSADQLDVNKTDLSRLLLDDPQITLKLNNEVFAFGDINPLDKKRYVLYRDKVHLIHDNLYPQLSASPTFFIDTKVIPQDRTLKLVQYPQFRLLKENDTWTLESELDISDEKINTLARTWIELRANSVREYQPLEPLYEIKVEFENGESIRYLVISDLPSLVLARPEINLQYHIPDYLSEKLFPREEAEPPGAE